MRTRKLKRTWLSGGPSTWFSDLLELDSYPDVSAKAFNQLCQLGCDESVLETSLWFLAPEAICWRGMDDRGRAGSGLTPDDLVQIHERAEKLLADWRKVCTTPIVGRLIAEQVLSHSARWTIESKLTELCRFVKIIEVKLSDSGVKAHPDTTEIRRQLTSHVHERTGAWHDKLIADFLRPVSTPDEPTSGMGQKQWRHRMGLVSSSGNTKTSTKLP